MSSMRAGRVMVIVSALSAVFPSADVSNLQKSGRSNALGTGQECLSMSSRSSKGISDSGISSMLCADTLASSTSASSPPCKASQASSGFLYSPNPRPSPPSKGSPSSAAKPWALNTFPFSSVAITKDTLIGRRLEGGTLDQGSACQRARVDSHRDKPKRVVKPSTWRRPGINARLLIFWLRWAKLASICPRIISCIKGGGTGAKPAWMPRLERAAWQLDTYLHAISGFVPSGSGISDVGVSQNFTCRGLPGLVSDPAMEEFMTRG
mmetsp:Transcript_1816/g.2565  ORF Transcript_1816/g.2565 Transcript_1816/m.2565 type:complete len:265 (+) Transcript_1816:248-1042(+)